MTRVVWPGLPHTENSYTPLSPVALMGLLTRIYDGISWISGRHMAHFFQIFWTPLYSVLRILYFVSVDKLCRFTWGQILPILNHVLPGSLLVRLWKIQVPPSNWIKIIGTLHFFGHVLATMQLTKLLRTKVVPLHLYKWQNFQSFVFFYVTPRKSSAPK